MNIVIQSPGISISNRLERIVFEKFERFGNPAWRTIRCEVVLRKERNAKNNDFVVEARLAIPGNDLFAKESGPRFEIAAESVCDSLERQLRKRKTQQRPKARVKARTGKRAISDEELE